MVATAQSSVSSDGSDAPALLKKSGKIEPMLISSLRENPWQPRQFIDPQSLEDLKKSIKDFGFIGYIPVRHARPDDPLSPLEIIYGHRRVMAARALGMTTVPVMLCDVDDEGMMRLAFVENSTQKRMTYWEEAIHFGEMRKQLKLTVRQLGDMLGLSRNYVFNRLKLLTLPDGSPLRLAAERNEISMSNAWVFANLAKALTPDELETLIADVRSGTLTHDDLQGLQKALDKAMEIDEDLDEDGRKVRVSTLIEQARAKEMRPRPFEPEIVVSRMEREAAAAETSRQRSQQVEQLYREQQAEELYRQMDDDTPRGPSVERAAEMATEGIRRTIAVMPETPTPDSPAIAVNRVIYEPSNFTPRDGLYYARETIEQLRGVAQHLMPRLDKADFTRLPSDERAEFAALRRQITEGLSKA